MTSQTPESKMKKLNIQIKRICAGYYEISDPAFSEWMEFDYSVTVYKRDHAWGWIARAEWARDIYTDPIRTYKNTKEAAFHMLQMEAEWWENNSKKAQAA